MGLINDPDRCPICRVRHCQKRRHQKGEPQAMWQVVRPTDGGSTNE